MQIYLDEMPPFPQEEPAFMPLLKTHVPFVPQWAARKCPKSCLDTKNGIGLKCDFPDDEKLLDPGIPLQGTVLRTEALGGIGPEEIGIDHMASPSSVQSMRGQGAGCAFLYAVK